MLVTRQPSQNMILLQFLWELFELFHVLPVQNSVWLVLAILEA